MNVRLAPREGDEERERDEDRDRDEERERERAILIFSFIDFNTYLNLR